MEEETEGSSSGTRGQWDHTGMITRRRSRGVVNTEVYGRCKGLGVHPGEGIQSGPGTGAQWRRWGAGAGIKAGGEGDISFPWLHWVGPGSCLTQTGWGEGGPQAEASTSFPSRMSCVY